MEGLITQLRTYMDWINHGFKLTRTLKNGGTPATYTVQTEVPSGILVKVEPNRLSFGKINKEETFKVQLEAKRDDEGG